MDFGLLYEHGVDNADDEAAERAVFWNALEQVKLAEESGFTHVWAVEHHFLKRFSHSSAPEIWLSAVAQRTSTIRIGHGVVLAPATFNHPVRVAERVATLDVMSNGRVECGFGRSITAEELGGFMVDPAASRPMLLESVKQIAAIWQANGQPLTLEGTYTSMPERAVLPHCVQKPTPPMWMACTSPESYRIAGELGMGILAFGWAISPEAMGKRIAEYRLALSECQDPVGGRINDNAAVFLMGYCADTDAEAKRVAEGPFTYYIDQSAEYFLSWGRGGGMPPGYEWYAKASEQEEQLARQQKYDYLFDNGMLLCGTPERIATTIEAFEAAGATQIIIGAQLGDLPHERTMESLERMGEVIKKHNG